jgi:hypothetical protein
MQIRILDLDGALPLQLRFVTEYRPHILKLQHWGSWIRLACSFGRFGQFERELAALCPSTNDRRPTITCYGSGDFHHVSLALLRRLATPLNLLVLDNHPDWMRGVPFLHCGTWLYHAARLPWVKRIFHLGGEVDFDNYYQWMAPWRQLRSGKFIVFPALRRFQRGAWGTVPNEPVRLSPTTPVDHPRLADLLEPFRAELASRPLYISVDKDVLRAEESVVNWDSGHLTLAEVRNVLHAFISAACGQLMGLDIVGDWSPIHLRGWLRQFMHLTEHPRLAIDPNEATRCNQQTNCTLLRIVRQALEGTKLPVG